MDVPRPASDAPDVRRSVEQFRLPIALFVAFAVAAVAFGLFAERFVSGWPRTTMASTVSIGDRSLPLDLVSNAVFLGVLGVSITAAVTVRRGGLLETISTAVAPPLGYLTGQSLYYAIWPTFGFDPIGDSLSPLVLALFVGVDLGLLGLGLLGFGLGRFISRAG